MGNGRFGCAVIPLVARTGACGTECFHGEGPVSMCCVDAADVCLERVLVHFGAHHVALLIIGPAHPNQSRSHWLALGTPMRTHTHTYTYRGQRVRDIPTWGMAGLSML